MGRVVRLLARTNIDLARLAAPQELLPPVSRLWLLSPHNAHRLPLPRLHSRVPPSHELPHPLDALPQREPDPLALAAQPARPDPSGPIRRLPERACRRVVEVEPGRGEEAVARREELRRRGEVPCLEGGGGAREGSDRGELVVRGSKALSAAASTGWARVGFGSRRVGGGPRLKRVRRREKRRAFV